MAQFCNAGDHREEVDPMLIGDVVRWHGNKTPDREAIRWDEHSMTFGQLLRRVNQVANATTKHAAHEY